MTSLEAGTAANSERLLGVRFLGNARAYWRLLMRGAVLLMITLGIYRFWLTTDVRRFLWSNTEVAGESLEYTGTPLELLLGFLVAIAILIPVYAGFFLATLDLGTLGKLSGAIAFAALGLLGQYAIYRARRYRLTRTIYRGVRFHQSGSAWRYAFCAVFWWSITALTCGLAYPFQIASLERYKMRNTFYGDLAGSFTGSGLRLFLRGFPLWFLVFAPLALTVGAFVDVVDWKALADAVALGGDDVMSRIESGNPGFAALIVFAMLMAGIAAGAAALLYPAFQALVVVGPVLRRDRDALGLAHAARLWRLYALPVVRDPVLHRHGGDRCPRFPGGGRSCRQRPGRRRTRNRSDRAPAGRLCDYRARLFDHLSRDGPVLALAVGHGIAAIVRSFGTRPGQGQRWTKLGAG
jgi:uncharacterized membrane protein YjgN (DUF898 family)